LKWHKMGLPSPPDNGLPNAPKFSGQSLGIIAGKERWMVEGSGNFIWYEIWKNPETGRMEERRGWYTVRSVVSRD